MGKEMLSVKISGITCGNSIVRAKKAIMSIAGVSQVRIDLAENIAHITGNPSPDAVITALKEAGFAPGAANKR